MEELTLTQRFALLGLNGKESEHWSMAKQCVLRALTVAIYLEENYNSTADTWIFDTDSIKKAIKKSKRKVVEQQIIASLEKTNSIYKVKSLLGCDLFYDENISIKEYVSDSKEFECQLDLIRAEFLEEGPISDEGIIMVWLLRESLCIHDLFSNFEQNKIAIRMGELSTENLLAKALFPIEIHSAWETVVGGFLRMKSQFALTDFGKGFNFINPALDRKESIFIDTEAYFPNAKMRMENVLDRVSSQGHTCEVLRGGDVPIVKIDNIKYELIPHASKFGYQSMV